MSSVYLFVYSLGSQARRATVSHTQIDHWTSHCHDDRNVGHYKTKGSVVLALLSLPRLELSHPVLELLKPALEVFFLALA